MRAIVGIRPDPIMFVAINCENVKTSKDFYEKLGFVEQVRVHLFVLSFVMARRALSILNCNAI